MKEKYRQSRPDNQFDRLVTSADFAVEALPRGLPIASGWSHDRWARLSCNRHHFLTEGIMTHATGKGWATEVTE